MENQFLLNILIIFLYKSGCYSAHDEPLDISEALISKILSIVC